LLALPKTVAETVGIPPTAATATASWSCESLVRLATGVLRPSFVGAFFCRSSEDGEHRGALLVWGWSCWTS
ncbi:unnamed protein product, partial [Ectocarpus sp. 12 AP-2014]